MNLFLFSLILNLSKHYTFHEIILFTPSKTVAPGQIFIHYFPNNGLYGWLYIC